MGKIPKKKNLKIIKANRNDKTVKMRAENKQKDRQSDRRQTNLSFCIITRL